MFTPDIGLTQQATAQSNSSFFTADIQGQANKDPKKLAGMFESMFYRIMFQQIQDAQQDDPLMSSSQAKQIQGMWFDELSNELGSSGHLGMGDIILQEMEKRGQAKAPSKQGLIKDSI